MSCATESRVPESGELLNSLDDICRVCSDPFDQQVLTGGFQHTALTKSGSRKRLKSDGLAEQPAGTRTVRAGDFAPDANDVTWDSSVAAMLMSCHTSSSCGGLRSRELQHAGRRPVDALGVAIANDQKASARASPALPPSYAQGLKQADQHQEDFRVHEVPVLNPGRLAAAAAAIPTAASAFVPAPSSDGTGKWRDQPYSALLSGPGFDYGADEDGMFETDDISMGSAGSGSVGSGGFMIDGLGVEADGETDGDGVDGLLLGFGPSRSAGTAESGSGGRHTHGRSTDAAPPLPQPSANPTAAALNPLCAWPPAPRGSRPGAVTAAAVAAAGGAATGGAAGGAVSAGAAFEAVREDGAVASGSAGQGQPAAQARQVGGEDDEDVRNLPLRSMSSESVGSGGIEEPSLARAGAGAGPDVTGGLIPAFSSHASAPSAQGALGLAESADNGGGASAAPDPLAIDGAVAAAGMTADVAVGGAPPAGIVAMPMPAAVPAAGMYNMYDTSALLALQARLADVSGGGEPTRSLARPPSMAPMAPLSRQSLPAWPWAVAAAPTPPLPSLLPPEAYLGFISQLVDSVRTATQAAAEACCRHRNHHDLGTPAPQRAGGCPQGCAYEGLLPAQGKEALPAE